MSLRFFKILNIKVDFSNPLGPEIIAVQGDVNGRVNFGWIVLLAHRMINWVLTILPLNVNI